MIVGQAIVDLLREHTRVIIPEFGAIIMQPDFSDGLLFNQYIRYDDGLLLTYLVEVAGLTRDTAESAVFAFIHELSGGLEQGETVCVDDLGYFVSFENRIDLYGSIDEIPHRYRKEHRQTDGRSRVSVSSVLAARAAAARTEVADVSIDETPVEMDIPFHKNSSGDDDTFDHQKQLVIGLTLLVLAGIVYLAFSITSGHAIKSSDEPEPPAAVKVEEPVTSRQVDQDEALIGDESVIPSPLPNEKNATGNDTGEEALNRGTIAEEAMPTEAGGSSYHVISGVFRRESNANRLVIRCRRAGAEAQKLMRADGMFMVSVARFDSRPLAQEECSRMWSFHTGAWVARW